MKAYSTCVGEGPFTCEMFGDEAKALRDAGGEYGAATGRPRRVGLFDVPASRYGVRMQGADTVVLTKLDVLSYLDRVPVCVAYEVDGVRTTDFPTGDRLLRAKPVVEYVDGFGDVSARGTPCPRTQGSISGSSSRRSGAAWAMSRSARDVTNISNCDKRF